MPANTRRLCLAVIALTLPAGMASAEPVAATQPIQARGGLNPDSFYGKEASQGVSVRDSLEAIKKLEDARRMERLEDWNKAADWYQEVIEKYGQYVVPSATDKDKNISQYTGIGRPVQEQLAKWPKAGLDSYRNRYGRVAATLLESAKADDRDTLSRVVKLYFVTDAGKLAGIRLVDLLLEAGEFPEAAAVGDRLLDWHPNMVVERPKVLFRTALAYHLSGNEKLAKERFEQLKNKHAGAVGTLFGKDIVLVEAMERLLQVAPPATVAASSSAYRMSPGGDASRSMISAATGKVGRRMASIDYVQPSIPRHNPNNMAMQQAMMINGGGGGGAVSREPGASLGILPVADDGELFFQDGFRVYGVSLQSGAPLPGWSQTYPQTGGQFSIPTANAGGFRNPQFTLTLTDNAVLGVMGFSQRAAMMNGMGQMPDQGTRLVCLDRATGRLRWDARPSKITEENLKALDFSGSPLVVADNVYVIGRGGKNFNSEDCYVLCFDLNTGAYKWNCFIASSNSGNMGFGMPMMSSPESSLSHLAYSSGRVYILTNLGACAALDAYSGTISWLNIYPRDIAAMDPNMGWQRVGRGGSGSSLRSWEYNPVIVQEGKVFILPSDGKNIVVYDAVTGAEVKRLNVADFRHEDDVTGPKALVAVDGKHMYLTGGASLYCIDWTTPVVSRDASIVWYTLFPTSIRGRAFVTADSVFVCIEAGATAGKEVRGGGLKRIERFNPKTGNPSGKVIETYPKNRDWDEGEGPGNLLVSGDHVVVAGAKRVNVYSDMQLARKHLDDDVAAAPGDPEPRLRYAEVMFVAGQLPLAMEKLDETVKLLGGLQAMRPGPARDHFFSACIDFATKLQKAKRAEDIDDTTKLYDLAASAADGDSQQVTYRMSRARFHRDFSTDDLLRQAVELYQEILTNPKLRTVPLTDDDGSGSQAAIVAEKQIAAVKKVKASAYDAVEKRGADALAAAAADPALLKSVADSYPNSAAAPKAMIAAAQAYEAQKNYRLAAHTLRQAYTKFTEASDRSRWLEGMARNYLAMSGERTSERVDTSASRLASAVRAGAGGTALEKPLTLPGGKVLAAAGTSIEDALKVVRNYKSDAVAAKLPDFHVPTHMTKEQRAAYEDALEAWENAGADPAKRPQRPEPFEPAERQLVIADVSALIRPPVELRASNSRSDRIVAWSNGNLVLYPVGSSNPAGSVALPGEPRNVAWMNDGKLLLVWGDNDLTLLDGGNAAKKWSVSLKNLPKIEVVATGGGGTNGGGAADENAANDELNEQQVFINRRFARGRVVFNGQVVQALPVAAVPAAPAGVEVISFVQPADDKIIVATNAGQLFAVRTEGGAIDWHTRLAASAPITRLAATDDFTVAKVDDASSTQLVVLDTMTGRLVRPRWSFNNDSGNVPVNFALAPDGTLVWIQPDRICGKDLFEPKRELNFEVVAGQGDNAAGNIQMNGQQAAPIYAGAVNADQLIISEGRILVVNNSGKYVSVHSLETGKPLDMKLPGGLRAEARLATSGGDGATAINDWGVSMRVVGSKLYISSRSNGPVCYNLDAMAVLWNGTLDKPSIPNVQFQDPYVGQDHLVLLDRPTPKAPLNPPNPNVAPGVGVGIPNPNVAPPNPNAAVAAAPTRIIRLHCYSRTIEGGTKVESGLNTQFPYIRDDSGIADVQGVDGGFYYLTGDKKLHFLKGVRP